MTIEHQDLKYVVEHDVAGFESSISYEPDDFGSLWGDITDTVKKGVKAVGKAVEKGAEETVKFGGNAAKTAGKAAHSGYKAVDKVTGDIKDAIEKVPFVGKGLNAVIEISISTPIGFAEAVASGERIDKAALKTFKKTLSNIRTLAPYAQTVITFVPGIGQGVSGAIGASLAIAEGQSLDDAVIAGVKDAIPGGPAAKAAFEAGESVMQGKSAGDIVKSAAIEALPISNEQKEQVASGLNLAEEVTKGKPVDKALLKATVSTLSKEAQKKIGSLDDTGAVGRTIDASFDSLSPKSKEALTIGIAVGNAAKMQRELGTSLTSAETIQKLQKEGKRVTDKSTLLKGALSTVKDDKSFYLGIGLMQHSGVSRRSLLELRNHLPIGKPRLAFDIAISTHLGVVTTKKVKLKSNRQKFGYYVTHGMRTASSEQKTGMMRSVKRNPEAYAGAALAIKQIEKAKRQGIIARFIKWLVHGKKVT